MKLLIITPYQYIPTINSGHIGIYQLSNHLGQINEVVVIGVKIKSSLLINYNCEYKPVFHNKKFRYLGFIYFYKIKKICQQHNIEAILCESPYFGLLGLFLAKILKIPFFIRAHNMEWQRFKDLNKWWYKIIYCLEKYLFNKCAGIIAVTQEDIKLAQNKLKITPEKFCLSPHGTTLRHFNPKEQNIKSKFCYNYKLDSKIPILYFIGDNSYPPNYKAIEGIVDHLIPLLKAKELNYQIIIVGKGLPEKTYKKIESSNYSLYYLNFIQDLNELFHAVDLMLNPVLSGGGIKGKLVEALAHNIKAVSFRTGAIGVEEGICNGQLTIVADNDWNNFADAITFLLKNKESISQNYYDFFYWGNIAIKTTKFIENRGKLLKDKKN